MQLTLDATLLIPNPCVPPYEDINFKDCLKALNLHQKMLETYPVELVMSNTLYCQIWQEYNAVRWQLKLNSGWRGWQRVFEKVMRQINSLPEDAIGIETVQVNPSLLSAFVRDKIGDKWKRNLVVCDYRSETFIATQQVERDNNYTELQLRYSYLVLTTEDVESRETSAIMPLVCSMEEWECQCGHLPIIPFPYSDRLRAYADENTKQGNHVAVIVIAEHDANVLVTEWLRQYNSQRQDSSPRSRFHFREMDENEKKKAVSILLDLLEQYEHAVFVDSDMDSLDTTYGKAFRRALSRWAKPIAPVISDPYDGNERPCRDLREVVFSQIHAEFGNFTSSQIKIGRDTEYQGLQIADAVAYIHFRRREPFWRTLWERVHLVRD